MTDAEIKKRLDQIAVEMKRPGANVEKLSDEIDRLLGIPKLECLKPEERAMAHSWERSHRRGR